MRTIAIINQKGGCGKTTVSVNLASALSKAGKKTLLVDMDPQSHCAVGLAVPEEQIEQSIYDVLISTSRDEPMKLTEILWEISERFELAPASIDLAAFEQQMAGIANREDCLKYILSEVDGRYDFVIIDCPPAVGLLTFNALRAATDAIVPVETGYFSLHGLSRQLDTLSILCKQCDQQVNVGVLASMYDIRTKMGREILAELRRHFDDKMFKTVVNFNTKLKEAASLGQPISEYDPASKGHRDFEALASEIMGVEVKIQHQREVLGSLQNQLKAISSSADELLATVKPAAANQEIKAEVESVAVSEEIKVEAEPVAANEEIKLEVEPDTVSEEIKVEAEPVAVSEEIKVDNTDEKLAQFYGVRQNQEAVMFATLYPRAGSVQIAGDFNDWQPEKTPMEKISENGVWQIKLPLAKGKYHYRLVVDGQWQQDPYNEKTELNPYGEFNSVAEVQ